MEAGTEVMVLPGCLRGLGESRWLEFHMIQGFRNTTGKVRAGSRERRDSPANAPQEGAYKHYCKPSGALPESQHS